MKEMNNENVKDHDAFADSIVDVTVGLVNNGNPAKSDNLAETHSVKDSPKQESD